MRGAAAFPWPAAHFVGVGGVSMSGLAAALAALGVPCSGSDVADGPRLRRLALAGVAVRVGHAAAPVEALAPGTVVVHSTDVPASNPELAAARARGLPVEHRSAVLAWFLAHGGPAAAAVTGTHGKTTTTSLLGVGCQAAGLDPTVFVGADVPGLEGGNHRLGSGPVVAEADESDGSFVRYHPQVAVATALEPEHLEHYGGSFAAVIASFDGFLRGLPAGALAVLCGDDPRLRGLGGSGPEVLWYGLGPGADLTAGDLVLERQRTTFTARLHGRDICAVTLRLPGRHNVANALAALGAALRLGAAPEPFAEALSAFEGPVRRFQLLTPPGSPVTVVDDYAHNPAKVAAALSAARQRAGGRVLALFQPHRYHRTAQLMDAFGPAFRDCDVLWMTEVYAPAGEQAVPGVSGAALADLVTRRSGVSVRFVPGAAEAVAACLAEARPGDLVIVMGAGDITAAAHDLAARLGATAPA